MTNGSQQALNTQITQSSELSMAGMDIPWLLQQWADKTPTNPTSFGNRSLAKPKAGHSNVCWMNLKRLLLGWR